MKQAKSNKTIVYKKGDEIRYRLKNEEYFITSVIKELTDTSFVTAKNGFNINLKNIERVDRQKKEFKAFPWRKAGIYLEILGGAVILAETVNTLFISDNFDITSSAFVTGISLVAAGEILKHVEKRKVRIGRKYSLKILDLKYNYE